MTSIHAISNPIAQDTSQGLQQSGITNPSLKG